MTRTTFYKIEDKSDPKKFYIGSTELTLNRRMCSHREALAKYKTRRLYDYVSQKDNGFGDFNIIDLKEELKDGEKRYEKEQELINLYNPTLNTNRAFLSPEDNHKLHLIYWRRRNAKTIHCECGCSIKAGGIWSHRRSAKHQKLMFSKCLKDIIENKNIM